MLARKVIEHDKFLRDVVAALNELLSQPQPDQIGFSLPANSAPVEEIPPPVRSIQ